VNAGEKSLLSGAGRVGQTSAKRESISILFARLRVHCPVCCRAGLLLQTVNTGTLERCLSMRQANPDGHEGGTVKILTGKLVGRVEPGLWVSYIRLEATFC
jgi:hypothetical protein